MNESSKTGEWKPFRRNMAEAIYGCQNFLNLKKNPTFKTLISISILLGFYCTLIDYTLIIKKDSRITNSSPMGIMKDFLYCLDFLYLIDFILSAILYKNMKQQFLKSLILLLQLYSLIPIETIYFVMKGTNIFVYHGFRGRYIVRMLLFLINQFQHRSTNFTTKAIVLRGVIFLSVITILQSCYRIYYVCWKHGDTQLNSQLEKFNCKNMGIFEHLLSYSVLLGQNFNTNFLYNDCKYVFFTTYAMVTHFIVFVYFYYFCANLISAYLEKENFMFEFTTMSGLSLKHFKYLKRSKIKEWTYNHDIFHKFFKQYLGKYRFRWDEQSSVMTKNYGYSVSTIPEVMINEIYLDISWNMFKHSLLFRDQPTYFLRFIARYTSHVYLTKSEVIFKRGQYYDKMIYIESGVVHILAEENDEVPIMSFKGGTCLGELNLFLSKRTNHTVVCQTPCDLIIIDKTRLLKIKKIFPKIYMEMKTRALERITQAKEFCEIGEMYYEQQKVALMKTHLSLRYIKSTLRKYLAIQYEIDDTLKRNVVEEANLFDKSVFCTNYLEMYVIGDDVEKETSNHILRKGFNFKVHPNSTLITIWNTFIAILTCMLIIMFPLKATNVSPGEDIKLFNWFMSFITVVWLVDFISVLFFAKETKYGLETDLFYLLLEHTHTWAFWIDIVSSYPVDLVFKYLQGPIPQKYLTLLQINRFLKVYKVLNVMLKPGTTIKNVLLLHVFRLVFSFMTIVLLFYYLFDAMGIYDVALSIHKSGDIIEKVGLIYGFLFATPIVELSVRRDVQFWVIIIMQYLGFIWKLVYFTKLVAIYSYFIITIVEFENVVDDIKKMLTVYNIKDNMKRRIFRHLRLHYGLSRGLTLIRLNEMKEFLGDDICKFISSIEYFKLLKELPYFQYLSDNFITDISAISKIMFIPKHELVVQAGSIADCFYIILKGSCGFLAAENYVGQIKGEGETLLVLEAARMCHVVNNIIALTDCILLTIPQCLFNRLLIIHFEYFDYQEILYEVINAKKLEAMQEAELHITDELFEDKTKSFNFFKMQEFKKKFADYEWLAKYVIKISIVSSGKFLVYWEIFYSCIIYVAAFLATIPITSDYSIYSFWFWFFRVYEIISYVDIFLRHYVAYYNKNNIEIIHPKKTITHYLSSSFWVDFISTLPSELLTHAHNQRNCLILTVSRMNRFLKLYRIGGLKKYYNEAYMKENPVILLTSCAFLTFIVFSLVTTILILPFCKVSFHNSKIICPSISNRSYFFWPFFLKHYKTCLKNVFNMGIGDDKINTKLIWKYTVINILGLTLTTFITCVCTGLILNRNSNLTAFQIKMTRLVQFLNLHKIDKNLYAEIIKHYEHLWSISEGKYLGHTFKIFNKACYDDVMFSHFGDILKKSIIFENQPNVIIKDYLSHNMLQRDIFLIKGIIIRVNDIQNKIYIIIKGSVKVLGPDFSVLRLLHVGSAFGCLDNIAYHRATLIYAANTHCELLSINAQDFHQIITRYHNFYKYYETLLRNSNLDYIPNSPALEDEKKTQTILKQNDTPPKHKMKLKALYFLFKIRKEKKIITAFTTFFCFLSFVVECYHKITLSNQTYIVILLYTLDALHLIKMHQHFFTSYENEYGLIEYRYKKIALRYIKNPIGFPLDLFCCFPFEIITPCFKSKIHGTVFVWIRVNRLFRIIFVFLYINKMKNRLKINIYLVKACNIITIYILISQLSMIFLSNFELLPLKGKNDIWCYLDTLGMEIYLTANNLYFPWGSGDNPFLLKKSYSMSFMMIIVTTRYVTIYFIAEFSSACQILYNAKYRFNNFVGALKDYMISKGVSPSLQTRAINYLENCSKGNLEVHFPSFLANAPFYLIEGVLNSMFGHHLRKHPIFKKCHLDLLRQMSAKFVTIFFFPGDIIAFKGDIDSRMYFVNHGEIEGLSYDGLYSEDVERRFLAGDYFGYKQLFYENVGQDYTYKVVKKTTVVYLNRSDILNLLDFFPASKLIIYNTSEEN